MIRTVLLAAAAMMTCAAVPSNARDSRLVTKRFNAEEVTRIEGRFNVQASIAFGDDEHIENVAIGDSASWQVTPNKRANMLFVKPLGSRARTNMTVVTDKRTYFFDLAASTTAAPLYALRFTYADDLNKASTARPGEAPTSAEKHASATEDLLPPPAKLNFGWRQRGERKLFPTRVYDDGNSIYLSWPEKAPLPAIQIRNEKGIEGPVNFAVHGEVIVVEGVPSVLVLRSGKERATLERQGASLGNKSPSTFAAASGPIQSPVRKGR